MKERKTIYFLDGGLGNQLFQISHIIKLKSAGTNIKVSLDFLKIRNVDVDIIAKEVLANQKIEIVRLNKVYALIIFQLIRILRKIKIIDQLGIVNIGDKTHIKQLANTIFRTSYFQNSRFEDMVKYNPLQIYPRINLKNSCFIHIRGGDYLTYKNKKIYCQLNDNYYKKAIKDIHEHYGVDDFIVYTNDKLYARFIMSGIIEAYPFIKFSSNKTMREDFLEMSSCKYGILSNSTFAFWTSLMHYNEDKVIVAPRNWYNEKTYPPFIKEKWIIK